MPPPPPPPPNNKPTTGAANKEENVYIPSFISKRPFYATEDGDRDGDDNDYLRHQRREDKDDHQKSQWYDRGRKAGPAATKYRKGACENCGAMGHKAKDCLERPRKRGAKLTGKDIQADRLIHDVKMGWDAKRDRWNGYDASDYRNVVDNFNQMEELRKMAHKHNKKGKDDDDDEADGGDKYAEENDMSKHQSTATRQLRIREDTAKYLVNLDLESAKYDPKTRTLVDGGATGGKDAELYAEQGFLKASGEASEFEKAQRLAWEAQEKTGDTTTHLQANPTAGEFYRKKEREEAEKKRQEREKQLLERYGGGEADQKAMPAAAALRNMAITESETFVEYDEAGLIKGQPKKAARSKYPEDVYINNHTSVWGSWWSNFKWGYACCHSVVKNSYCTGEEGKEAWEAAERQRTGVGLIEEAAAEEEEEEEQIVEKKQAEEDEDEEKKKKKKKKNQPEPEGKRATRDEMDSGVTEEEMEAYRRKKTAANDPMANFLGRDELLDS